MTDRSPQRPDPGCAFVVWLDEPGAEAPRAGTVEHVGSATRARFDDLAGLSRWIERTLREAAGPRR
ncbi:MAG: hypothetical protein QNK05_08120 [Myxococcota bacterium]|nr:hypothetical protein [Myxococcota bacterium]